MCCWHQLLNVLSRRAGRSRGRSPRDRPAARQHTTTWCWPFPFLSTNILLIKSKLKLESRAIAVGVAMSPRNLGGKYHCRPHPRSRKFTRQFLREAERVNRTASEWRHRLMTVTTSCGVFKSRISVAHCPFQRKWRVLHIWYIPVLACWTGRYVF